MIKKKKREKETPLKIKDLIDAKYIITRMSNRAKRRSIIRQLRLKRNRSYINQCRNDNRQE